MKRLVYSGYTKFAAAVLCVLLISAGMLTAANGFIRYCDEERYIYGFENSFEDSQFVDTALNSVAAAVFSAYQDTANAKNAAAFDENLTERLSRVYESDVVNYYVAVNDKIYTNCGAQNADQLKNVRLYQYAARDAGGMITRDGRTRQSMMYNNTLEDISLFNSTDAITVCANISDAVAAKFEEDWNRQAEIVRKTFVNALICAILALLLMVYLICVAGKNRYGEQKTVWIDLVWSEVHLAAIAAAVIGAAAICALIFDAHMTSHIPVYMLQCLTTASAAAGGAVILVSGLSLVRKIKNGRFMKTSVVCIVIQWCCKCLIRVFKWLRKHMKSGIQAIKQTLAKKSGALTVSVLFIYTMAIAFCGLLTSASAFGPIMGVVIFGFGVFILAHRGMDTDKIREGAAVIRNGNLQYKISDIKSEDMKELAKNINEIGEGLEKTVSAQLRAERLKTDLITNVSHDLKTPLTSIISYTELLSQIKDLPEDARDYVSVISKKSQRLNNLTQDLFEVSKVQSGNETLNMEKLDAALLVSQTLGERDNEIQKSELKFCVSTDKELFFTADGRKMSRALGNLIDNALKYAMKGTRVFVSATARENRIVIEIKNISAYQMDFDADEITGRFVRGDKARASDGNGLGLAIAKSYTEVCGGKFDVIIDGDLFKVVISFEKD